MSSRSSRKSHLESPRWWLPSAVAGILASGAIVAIAVVPLAGNAKPMEPADGMYSQVTTTTPAAPRTVKVPGTDSRPGHACFMHRARWNVALDFHQPVC